MARSSRRWMTLLALGAVAVAMAVSTRPAEAVASHDITIVPGSTAGAIDLADLSFQDALDALGAGGSRTVALPIPGLGTIPNVPMDLTTVGSPAADDAFVVLSSTLADTFGELGGAVNLVVQAYWSDPTAAPQVALALDIADDALETVVPAWPGLTGVAGAVQLASGVITLVPDGSTLSLDPAILPPELLALYDLAGTDPPLAFDDVATLVADLDLSSMPVLDRLARFVGYDPTESLTLVGSIADTASFLFDSASTLDPSTFSLDAPIELDSSQLPAWLTQTAEATGIGVPEFRVRLDPGGGGPLVPRAYVAGTAIVDTGQVSNAIDYEISLDDVADLGTALEVHLSAPSFTVPFGLDWMGPLTDVTLDLAYDDATTPPTYAGDFRADAVITAPGPQELQIDVASDPLTTTALVHLTGPVAVDDLLGWLGGSGAATPTELLDLAGVGSATIEELELTYDSTGPVLGGFAQVDGLLDGGVRVRLLVGADAGQAPAALLAALVVDAPSDACDCIRLSQVLPVPAGTLAGDFELPELRFLHSSSSSFPTERLGPAAQAFLEEVTGAPLTTTLPVTGELQMSLDVPLDDLAPILGALDIAATGPLHLEGSAGFTIPDLASSPATLLENLDLRATLPGFTSTPTIDDFPSWLSLPATGAWEFFLSFDEGQPETDADDSLVLGVSIDDVSLSGIHSSLADQAVDLRAAFEGNPAAGDWTVTMRAALSGPWNDAFGIDWLDVTSLYAEVVIDSDPGRDPVVQLTARLRGEFEIAEVPLAVEVQIGTDGAEFTVALESTVKVGQVVSTLFGSGAPALPDSIATVGFGPGAITVRVTGDSADVTAVGSASFDPYADDPADARAPISVSAIAAATFDLSPFGLEQITIGIRPDSELSLSRLLPVAVADTLPIDFVIAPAPPASGDPTSGFGLVFSTPGTGGPGTLPIDQLSDIAQDWFAPLFGGDASGRTLGDGFSALGAFAVPAPFDDLSKGLGFEPYVLASGNLPIPGTSDLPELNLALRFEVDHDLLAQIDFVDSLGIELALTAGTDGVAFGLELNGTLRFMQGIDPAVTDSIAEVTDALTGGALPIDFSAFAASPVAADATCPRGGVVAQAGVPADVAAGPPRYFCYDLIDVAVGGEVGISFNPGVELFVALEGSITSRAAADDPGGEIADAGWAPFGIDSVIIRQIIGRIELGVNPAATPTPISLVLGGLINGSVDLGTGPKAFAGALQFGVNIGATTTPPPVPIVRPSIEKFGLMLSLPGGLAKSELVDLYELMADAIGAEPIGATELNALPNVGVRDLFFSLSPLGVPDLCIGQGISLKGDLYVYTGAIPAASPPPVCSSSGTPPPVPPNQCLSHKDDGCVASMLFSLTPTGIIAEGTLAAFDMAPIPIEFTDDVEVVFRLTTDDQVIRLAGGARVGLRDPVLTGPITDTWASGRMAFELRPTQMVFAGQLEVFGFNVLADAEIGLGDGDLLAILSGGFDPHLSLHVVLAGAELSAPEFATYAQGADFQDVVTGFVQPTLDQFEALVRELDRLIADFNSDPLGTLLDLPNRLAAAGVDVPPDVTAAATAIKNQLQGVLDAFNQAKDDADATVDATLLGLLNGYTFPGVRSSYFPTQRTCVAGFSWNPLEEISEDNPTLISGTVDEDGKCWIIEGWVAGFWQDPVCLGVAADGSIATYPESCYLIPPFHIDGICPTLFPDLGSTCTLSEVRGEIEDLFGGVIAQIVDLAGSQTGDPVLPDIGAIIDTVRGFLEPAGSSTLFDLECAEFRLDLHAFGDSQAQVALDSVIFGAPLEFGVNWTFAIGDAFAIDGSVDDMVADFWRFLTTGGSAAPCTGADPQYFGPGGIDFGPQLEHLGVDPENPPPPPPPVLASSVSPRSIDEGASVTLTVGFDRTLQADDGARTLSVDWGDSSAATPVTIHVGGQSTTVTHTYADDDPTGTLSDVFTIHATDVTSGVASPTSASTTVLVRNVAPVVDASLDVATIDENGSVALTVDWTDPGLDDTHRVAVVWGDGAVRPLMPATSGTVLHHTYTDDDPTATTSDNYSIVVTVVDDDGGVGTDFVVARVDDVAPTAAALTLSPNAVDEGTPVNFIIAFDDAGPDDSHVVEADFDGDGVFDVQKFTNAGDRSVTMTFEYPDDDPTGTPSDIETVDIRIADDDMYELDSDGGVVLVPGAAWTEQQRTVTVRNVAPVLCASSSPEGFGDENGSGCPPPTDAELDEGQTATVTAGFSDPGALDDHVVVIDWGTGALDPVVLGDTALVTPPSAVFDDTSFPFHSSEWDADIETGPLPRGTRTFAADAIFGDNGTFPVHVWVIDDDTGVSTTTWNVVVANVDPVAAIDTGSPTSAYPRTVNGVALVLADGPDDDADIETQTFLTRAGVSTAFRATASDPGSDDLTFRWRWDALGRFGDPTTTNTSRVDTSRADPLPSPELIPRVDVADVRSSSWAQPCLYQVELRVTDDDAGTTSDSTWVVVTGTDKRIRNAGWWFGEFDTSKKKGKNDLDDETLRCYVDVARHMSAVFDHDVSTSTFDNVRTILLQPSQKAGDDKLDRQLLTTWFNLANGSLDWFTVVPTPEGPMPLLDALRRGEAIYRTGTRNDRIDWKSAFESING